MREVGCDVVVVGAGLAGLVAARELRRAGVDAVVLEARNRVGGRTLNHPIGDGKVVELGGQWVGPGQDRINALIEDLGLETFDTFDDGENLFEHNGKVRRYRGVVPKVSPAALLDFSIALRRLNRMARTVPPAAPWTAPNAASWDEQTLATWTRRNLRTALGREFVRLACEAVWAADPADVSLLHFLVYANAGGGLERLLSVRGGAQQSRVVGGSHRIALALAEELGDAVVCGAPVREIEQGDGVLVTAAGITARARRAIIAVSPTLAARLRYQPPLPSDRDQLTQRIPNGSVIKCMAIYDEPFWRTDGLSGLVTSISGPVRIAFDNSPPDGKPGVLLGFLEGTQARRLGRLPAIDRRQAILDCFTTFFGPRAADPIDYIDKNWAEEEWTRGCYGAVMPPNTWTAFGHALRKPAGLIHWAGAETAVTWLGYMDGAVSSAHRAATEVLAELSANPSRNS